MSLQDWVRNGWASHHKSTRDEIHKLLSLAVRDLASCATKGLATDWQFAIAYNSALQSATAALAAAGYRASREAHHHRVIDRLLDGARFNVKGGVTDVRVHQRLPGGRELCGVLAVAKLRIA